MTVAIEKMKMERVARVLTRNRREIMKPKTPIQKSNQSSTPNSKKGSKPIAPDKAVKVKFEQEQAHRNFVAPRRELNNQPHRMSKAEKGARKK